MHYFGGDLVSLKSEVKNEIWDLVITVAAFAVLLLLQVNNDMSKVGKTWKLHINCKAHSDFSREVEQKLSNSCVHHGNVVHAYRARIISWRFCVNILWNAIMRLAQKVDHWFWIMEVQTPASTSWTKNINQSHNWRYLLRLQRHLAKKFWLKTANL